MRGNRVRIVTHTISSHLGKVSHNENLFSFSYFSAYILIYFAFTYLFTSCLPDMNNSLHKDNLT